MKVLSCLVHGIGGRGRSRTYRGRLAPSNGFEARASHRTRCSSEIDICRFCALDQRSSKRLASAQDNACVAGPSGRPHLIEVLEDLDRHIAAEAAMILEGRG